MPRASGVWESNPPAAALLAVDSVTAPVLADLHLSLDLADSESAERFRLFEPGAATLVEADERESFHPLQGVELIDTESRRGPPESYPETRVWIIEVLGTTFVGEATGLSVELRPACGGFSCGVVPGDGKDPLGLVTQKRAEFGQDDVLPTVDLETGNGLFDATVLNTFNTAVNHVGFLLNAGFAALGAVDRTRLAVERAAGLNGAEIEFLDAYAMTNPQQWASGARGLQHATKVAIRTADKLLSKIPVRVVPGEFSPSMFGVGNIGKKGVSAAAETASASATEAPAKLVGTQNPMVAWAAKTGRAYDRRITRLWRRFEGKTVAGWKVDTVNRRVAPGLQPDLVLIQEQQRRVVIHDVTSKAEAAHMAKGERYAKYYQEKYPGYDISYQEGYWEGVEDFWEALSKEGDLYLPSKTKPKE